MVSTARRNYVPPQTVRRGMKLEGNVCAASYVIKEDMSKNAEVSIDRQTMGDADDFTFEFDTSSFD